MFIGQTRRPTLQVLAGKKIRVTFQAPLVAEFGCVCLNISQMNIWTVCEWEDLKSRALG